MDIKTTQHAVPQRLRKEMRLKDFDYSSQGVYFITIVTHHRTCLFGRIENGEMILNEAGKMVLAQYQAIDHHDKGVKCMDVVVMPNHMHYMIYLHNHSFSSVSQAVKTFKSVTTVAYIKGVKTKGWLPFDAHLWQRNYWDDIVRNERMFLFVRRYIQLNPQRWDQDLINEDHGPETDDINDCIAKLRS